MIRAAFTFVIVAVTLCFTTGASDGYPTSDQLFQYEKKISNHREDLTEIIRHIGSGEDFNITLHLIDITFECTCRLIHLEDLVFIRLMLKSAADRARIDPILKRRIKEASESIDLSIKNINLHIPYLVNRAILSTAIQLRADLRSFNDLLQGYP